MSTDPSRFADLRGAFIAKYAVGRLENRDSERLAAVSIAAIGAVIANASADTVTAFAKVLAQSTESKVKAALGDSLESASAESVAHAMNIGFAQAGLGQLHFERWGDVLTIRWNHPPGTTGPLADLSMQTLQIVLQNVTLPEAHVAPLSADNDALWLLVASAESCAMVTIEGKNTEPTALLARLQSISTGVSQS